ncbi:MAG: Holliday junction branch migration protein RuvA [Candidatus Kapaibacterium sp.]
MIARLEGKLIEKSSTYAVVDCNGVGYMAMISVKTSEKLPGPGEKTVLMTHLIPREDALNLFGFYDATEREAFRMLITISGIGPKIALGILSAVTLDELAEYLLNGNIPALKKLPGIGLKTAERLHLELKDKIGRVAAKSGIQIAEEKNYILREAVAALTTLGYPAGLAEKAAKNALKETGEEVTAEDLIKTALRYAMK